MSDLNYSFLHQTLSVPLAWSLIEWDDFVALGLFTLVLSITLYDSSFFSKDHYGYLLYEYPQGKKTDQKATETNIAAALNDQVCHTCLSYKRY